MKKILLLLLLPSFPCLLFGQTINWHHIFSARGRMNAISVFTNNKQETFALHNAADIAFCLPDGCPEFEQQSPFNSAFIWKFDSLGKVKNSIQVSSSFTFPSLSSIALIPTANGCYHLFKDKFGTNSETKFLLTRYSSDLQQLWNTTLDVTPTVATSDQADNIYLGQIEEGRLLKFQKRNSAGAVQWTVQANGQPFNLINFQFNEVGNLLAVLWVHQKLSFVGYNQSINLPLGAPVLIELDKNTGAPLQVKQLSDTSSFQSASMIDFEKGNRNNYFLFGTNNISAKH